LQVHVKQQGSSSLVYIDETGFDTNPTCVYGWSKRGQRIFGDQQGKRTQRESLVAARRNHIQDFIAPMLYTGCLNAIGFVSWLSRYCLPELDQPSLLIMDNAPIHPKGLIQELVEAAGHQVLFLPKYSPDFNKIEHDFSALKRARMYADPETSIDEIIRNYCAA